MKQLAMQLVKGVDIIMDTAIAKRVRVATQLVAFGILVKASVWLILMQRCQCQTLAYKTLARFISCRCQGVSLGV
jgi:hypothetical protein